MREPDDDVDGPPHYTADRTIEPIAAILDWKLDYLLGSAVKYISRAGRKGDEATDVRKAIWFLQRKLDGLVKNG